MTDIVSVHLAIVTKPWLASLANGLVHQLKCVPEATNENTDLYFGMLFRNNKKFYGKICSTTHELVVY